MKKLVTITTALIIGVSASACAADQGLSPEQNDQYEITIKASKTSCTIPRKGYEGFRCEFKTETPYTHIDDMYERDKIPTTEYIEAISYSETEGFTPVKKKGNIKQPNEVKIEDAESIIIGDFQITRFGEVYSIRPQTHDNKDYLEIDMNAVTSWDKSAL